MNVAGESFVEKYKDTKFEARCHKMGCLETETEIRVWYIQCLLWTYTWRREWVEGETKTIMQAQQSSNQQFTELCSMSCGGPKWLPLCYAVLSHWWLWGVSLNCTKPWRSWKLPLVALPAAGAALLPSEEIWAELLLVHHPDEILWGWKPAKWRNALCLIPWGFIIHLGAWSIRSPLVEKTDMAWLGLN